jgi:hypothetical protein
MKAISTGRLLKSLMGYILCILFVLWLGSLIGWNWGLEGDSRGLGLGSDQAVAAVNDFNSAQDVILTNDSLIVEDVAAAPGNSFWVTVRMANTRPLVGWQLKLVYNDGASLIVPDTVRSVNTTVDPPETSWQVESQLLGRAASYSPSAWLVLAAPIRYLHLDTLRFTAALNLQLNPPPSLIPAGSGQIVRFKFFVKPDAVPGSFTDINFDYYWSFLSGETFPANNFADTSSEFLIVGNTIKGRFTVSDTGGTPENNCPVFELPSASSFDINEGATLRFDVRATDEDGDSITLSLDPLDPGGLNYSFDTKKGKGSVTQTFEYTPGFTEAPATRYLNFRAVDEHGCLTTKSITIHVIETEQDLLMASTLQGGVPGSKDRLTPFMITNSVPIYGFQFTFRWDAAKLAVDSIAATDAISGFSMYTNLGDSAGKATVLVFGLAGQTIPVGLDTMVYPAFRVLPGAPPGEVELKIENAREAINPGYPSFPLGMVNGTFWVDMFGDCNLDLAVDVGDIISIVHYILGEITFGTRQEQTADANQDSLINVADLVAMIDMILGRWMGPSPSMYPGPMAYLKLDYEDLLAGSSDEVEVLANLEVPVAGAQLEIEYDPAQVTFKVPRLAERSDHFLVEYRDDGSGKLNLLMYNLSNRPIPAGEGSIISLPAVLSPYASDDVKIQLKKVVLADEKAALIPVGEGAPSIPVAFKLDQNYPNPFNPSTAIKFSLPARSGGGYLPTTLRVYNVLGQLVRTLVDEPMAAGTHEIIWDGKDDHGSQVASGIYFYKLRSGDYEDTKKMVLMK